jgi:methionyl-tRNA synthetase
MDTKYFYITTPIYYANAVPHIGNAYTSLIADVYARMHRMLWYHVKFTTGTDENGQKMVQTAAAQGKEVMEFLDEVAGQHQQVWDALQISYTDFIRTTELRHRALVQSVLQKSYDAGDIYQWEYDGLYCIWCEWYKKLSDLTPDGLCPDHLKKPELLKEKNRFFRLSNYQDRLLEYYTSHQDFCTPSHRFHEVKSFVEQGLEDFSISRQGSTFGIPIPFDPISVTYIWFDALYNYVTSCQWDDEMYRSEHCQKVHVLGKDIARFHAIYRPAMLISAGYVLPDLELINGFFTVDGQKMSKSLGNSLDPVALVDVYSRDALVYYLFADIKLGSDGDFSLDRLLAQKDSNLKNGWSNLVNRVVSILRKQEVHQFKVEKHTLQTLLSYIGAGCSKQNILYTVLLDTNTIDQVKSFYFDAANIAQYLSDRYEIVGQLNAYIASTEPRKTIKWDESRASTLEQLQAIVYCIKYLAIMIAPFLIEGTWRIKDILQFDHEARTSFGTLDTDYDVCELISFDATDITFGEWYIYS